MDIFDLNYKKFEKKVDNILDNMTQEELLQELKDNGLEANRKENKMSKAILEAIKKKKCKRCKYFYDCDVFTWCEKDIKKGRQPTKLICFKFKKDK